MSALTGNKLGILFPNKKHLDPELAVRMALAEFTAACHTIGHTAREVHFHPSDAPAEAVRIAGLVVFVDKNIPPHHIRVTTAELSPTEMP